MSCFSTIQTHAQTNFPALGGSGVGSKSTACSQCMNCRLVTDPTYDWLLSTTPQAQLGNRTFLLGRGKVLGGTSAMNLMQYTKYEVPPTQTKEQ